MNFDTFKGKVEQWATVRGIYDQSTEAHQQAKALEEIGEFLTATTDPEMMDAVGDIAVCIVNSAKIYGQDLRLNAMSNWSEFGAISYVASSVCAGRYRRALENLCGVAQNNGLSIAECFDSAWEEIKDRLGMMVNGKFVKWENLTDDQKAEFLARGAGQ